jgi:hypothetical protein
MENARIKKRRGARPGVQEEGMESESECCSGCFADIPVLTEVVRAMVVPEGPVMWENIWSDGVVVASDYLINGCSDHGQKQSRLS